MELSNYSIREWIRHSLPNLSLKNSVVNGELHTCFCNFDMELRINEKSLHSIDLSILMEGTKELKHENYPKSNLLMSTKEFGDNCSNNSNNIEIIKELEDITILAREFWPNIEKSNEIMKSAVLEHIKYYDFVREIIKVVRSHEIRRNFYRPISFIQFLQNIHLYPTMLEFHPNADSVSLSEAENKTLNLLNKKMREKNDYKNVITESSFAPFFRIYKISEIHQSGSRRRDFWETKETYCVYIGGVRVIDEFVLKKLPPCKISTASEYNDSTPTVNTKTFEYHFCYSDTVHFQSSYDVKEHLLEVHGSELKW